MKTYLNWIFSVCFVGMMLAIQSCGDDEVTQIVNVDMIVDEDGLQFKATNLSSQTDKELYASSGKTIVNVTWTTAVTVNGKTTVVSGSSKSNELPVMAGDEIEVVFTPTCKEESEASFLLPDGTSKTVTASSPSFRWIVPENFSSGMKIEGRSTYEIDGTEVQTTGAITLVSLENYM